MVQRTYTTMTHPEGQKVVEVREMNESEFERMSWIKNNVSPLVIVLEDETVLLPSKDSEGNKEGRFVGVTSSPA